MKFQTYLILVLTVAFFGLVGLGSYFFMMQSRRINELQSAPPRVITSPESSATLDSLPAASPDQTVATASPSPVAAVKTVQAQVTFDAASPFTTAEKTQIQSKIVDPYLLYHQSDVGEGNLLTLTISRNLNASSKGEYPYSAAAVFDTGVNQGFLIRVTGGLVDQGGQVDWWIPECLIQCPYSDAFKAAYPEIVAKTEGE